MEASYVTEYCPECESEIELRWDVSKDGYKTYCPVCGNRLMLCDACHHRRLNGEYIDDCDYCSDTDTCRFNKNDVDTEQRNRIYDEICVLLDDYERRWDPNESDHLPWYELDAEYTELFYAMLYKVRSYWKPIITGQSDDNVTDFLDDEEKMVDFLWLSKDEFLASYSYLTEKEYKLTYSKLLDMIKKQKGDSDGASTN